MNKSLRVGSGGTPPGSTPWKRHLDRIRAKYFYIFLALAFTLAPKYSFGQISIRPCPKGTIEPPPGLVAWWPLGETAGATQVIDKSGNGNHGTAAPGAIGSTAPIGPKPVPGFVGGAMRFYFGSLARVKNNSQLNFGPTTSFSMDAWIQGGSGPVVTKLGPPLAPTAGYSFSITGAGPKPTLSLQIGTKTVSWNGGPTIPSGAWYFVAVTVNRTKNPYAVRFYKGLSSIDFIQSPQRDLLPGNAASGGPLEIGKCPGNPNGCIAIDEPEIFKRVLSYDEVKKIFNAGRNGKCIKPPKFPDKIE